MFKSTLKVWADCRVVPAVRKVALVATGPEIGLDITVGKVGDIKLCNLEATYSNEISILQLVLGDKNIWLTTDLAAAVVELRGMFDLFFFKNLGCVDNLEFG
jgi:hypothetical protein